ncbi:MAG: glutamate--cysteine ligase, partial [Zoogloea sp.]|nr:glutamate--cysteine ligase [Zoogloea sp.]
STLSYGPDLNLSMPGWTPEQCLDAARKLNWYSPFIVPFSFSSPFAAGQRWPGWSKRTFERAPLRPAVKLFLAPDMLPGFAARSRLVHPARLPREAGRIEFKAFDAQPSLALLAACCHLLEGICLADDLPGRSEHADLELYRRAALHGFDDASIHAGAAEVLAKARNALQFTGRSLAALALQPLENLLAERRTPAHDLLAAWRDSGLMYKPGGHAGYMEDVGRTLMYTA